MYLSNENLMHLLLSDREKAFEYLYEKVFPRVARFVRQMGGDFSDAKDIFQDALIVFYEKTVVDNLLIKVSAQAYILGVSKHLWSRRFRGQQSYVPLDELERNLEVPDDFNAPHTSENRLLRYLEMAGRRCMDLLQGFYYQNMNMQEIASVFGFGSVRSATVQKYKCLEKVRQHVKASDHEEIFA